MKNFKLIFVVVCTLILTVLAAEAKKPTSAGHKKAASYLNAGKKHRAAKTSAKKVKKAKKVAKHSAKKSNRSIASHKSKKRKK